MTAHRDPRRFHPGIIGTKNSPNPIRQSQFHFGAINWPICYQKKTARKNAVIEISAVFKMEADLTKKRGRGRPRGSTNAKAKQRKMALRRAQYAEIREIDRTIQLDSLAILEEVMRHFFWKARILEGMGTEGDFNEVDKAWAETGRWAKEVAAFRHAKIQSIRLAGDPNAPVLPEHMTLDQLRESIIVDFERLREMGVLDLPRLPQGVVANPNADLPMNGGSSDPG
jgi:hypothetical protein